ncbi:hypothetical protein DL93DRAFT_2171469 [Clavulina sp. PMI_390]|nr:hypothetical protein DL93DRAFT_2171469 [Clavulina sp. PMI_390]
MPFGPRHSSKLGAVTPSPRALIPDVRYEILQYLGIAEIKSYSQTSRALYDEAFPFIWRQATVGGSSPSPEKSLIEFNNFIIANPGKAALITSLSLCWTDGLLPLTPRPDDCEEINETTESFNLFRRAAACFTQLKRLRVTRIHKHNVFIDVTLIPSSVVRVFARSPIKLFAFCSSTNVDIHPQFLTECVAWKQTLTHLIIDNLYCSGKADVIPWPPLPVLRCLVTHEHDVVVHMLSVNPRVRSLYFTGKGDPQGSTSPWASPFVLRDINKMCNNNVTTSELRKFIVHCRGPHPSASFGQILQAVKWQKLEEFTVFMDYNWWSPRGRIPLAEYVVAELSMAYAQFTSALPKLRKLHLRIQGNNNPVCTLQANSAQHCTEAAAHLLELLERASPSHPCIETIEIRSQGRMLTNYAICSIQASRGESHQWEVKDSYENFPEDQWDERSLYKEAWTRNDQPDYFDSRVPLHALENMLTY